MSFQFSIGGRPVKTGKIWLFYFRWGSRDVHGLSEIRNGRGTISVEPKVWFTEYEPEVFAIVVDVPGSGWYRTSDLRDAAEAVTAVEKLGTARVLGGVHHVDLPRPAQQKFRTLNVDGTPRPKATVRFQMWVTEANHCGVHEGFDDWRTLTTDRDGVAAFTAPLYPLFVEADYYKEIPNPDRRLLSSQNGERVDAGLVHVLQGVWDRPRERTFRIHVQGPDGRPAVATLLRDDDGCMSAGTPVGSTDEHGDILATFAPELVGRLTLVSDYREYERGDDFTDEELNRLINTGRISIVWPRRR